MRTGLLVLRNLARHPEQLVGLSLLGISSPLHEGRSSHSMHEYGYGLRHMASSGTQSHMRIPDEIVVKAVVAKGQVRDHGGIGASMRAALEAVVDDLLELQADLHSAQRN